MSRPFFGFRKSIRTRLLFYFIFMSTLPILLVGSIPYLKSSEIVKGQVLEYAQSTINQMNENINYHMKEIDLLSRIIYYQIYSLSDQDQKSLKEFIMALKNNRPFIDEIHVFIGYHHYSTSPELDKGVLEEQKWYTDAVRNREKTWVGLHPRDYYLSKQTADQVISLVYPFEVDQSKTPAIILIDMKGEMLEGIFSSPTLNHLGTLLLIDKLGHIIYSSDQSFIHMPEELKEKYIMNTKLLNRLSKDNSFVYAINYLSGWRVAAFIPNEQISQSFDSVKRIVLQMIGIFLIISILLAWILSNRLVNPLRKLQFDMRAVKKGDFSIRSHIKEEDEIGELSQNFNQMVEEIQSLIDRMAENERKKKEVEMQSLQYQINPHFLYNTLNSVQWLAKLHKVPDISEMLTDLIKLLRASLNSRGNTHMLEEELEILSYYIRIQAYRFADDFKVKYDMDSKLLSALVPRFIIQPLVENSFFHGFTDGQGEIEIRALCNGDDLEIQIEDNGRGISLKDQEGIFKVNPKKKQSSGIGIKNVDEKIKLYFGKQYGLSISSQVGKGTTVTILLPYIPKKEGDETDVKGLIG